MVEGGEVVHGGVVFRVGEDAELEKYLCTGISIRIHFVEKE